MRAADNASSSSTAEQEESDFAGTVDPTLDVWDILLQNRVEELGALDAEARIPDPEASLGLP